MVGFVTILVTGASGHVGVNLLRRLRANGREVRALVHRNRGAFADLDVETVEGDVLGADSMRAAMDGVDTVYHLAAKISIVGDPDGSVRRINTEGPAVVAKAARLEGARMVHVSSVHAFDLASVPPGQVLDESFSKSTRSGNYAYDQSKAAGEARVREEVDLGLDAVIVNPTGIMGPVDPAPSRMGSVMLDLAAGRMPALVAGAFDFVDVRDVVESLVAARRKGDATNHLLGGHHLSVRQIADVAESITGVRAPRWTLPLWAAYAGIPFAALAARIMDREPTFTRESLGALAHGPPVNHDKAHRVLGHSPRPIEETVRDLYAWFAEEAA